MASATTTYNFTDEEVSHLANCDTQDDFLFNFQRILQTKGIDVTAVFDTQTTLGSSTDYGASVLTRFFENQSHALHLEVGYALFKSCNQLILIHPTCVAEMCHHYFGSFARASLVRSRTLRIRRSATAQPFKTPKGIPK